MLTEEALKALDGVKDELKSEIKVEAEKTRTELAGAITSEVIAKVEEQLKDVKKPSDTKTSGQEDMLKYFKAKYNKDIHGKDSEDLKLGRKYFEIDKKDLDTATATSGEELVPEYFGNEVIRVAEKVGVARQNSRVITLPGKQFTLPTMGSAVAYRTNEKAKITASALTTGNLVFTAKKVAGMVIATRETIEDANIDVVSWIAQILGEAVAKLEDQWAFLGITGTEGIFRNASVPVYTLGSGEVTYAACTLDDLRLSLDLMDENLIGGAKWLKSFSMFNHFRGEKDSVSGQYVLQNPAGTMPKTIWDLPYVLSGVMPKRTDSPQANKPFMACYNPNYLMIGDRRAVSLEFAKEATVTSSDGSTQINLFEQDYVAIKITERLDIQLAEPAKAFVRLATSAS